MPHSRAALISLNVVPERRRSDPHAATLAGQMILVLLEVRRLDEERRLLGLAGAVGGAVGLATAQVVVVVAAVGRRQGERTRAQRRHHDRPESVISVEITMLPVSYNCGRSERSSFASGIGAFFG